MRLGHDWSWAELSECGKYRYAIGRRWLATKPMILWIMLNPSTADHNHEDPTIRRVIDYSQRWGFGAMVVCNLWPMRTAYPWILFDMPLKDALGPDGVNDRHIRFFADHAEKIICAWGANGQKLGQGERVRQMLNGEGLELNSLRMTKTEQPSHPLYLPKKLEPVQWEDGR